MADNDTETIMTEDGAGETVERSRLALLGGLTAAATTGGCSDPQAYDRYRSYSAGSWGSFHDGGDSERDRDDDDNSNENNDVGSTPGGGAYD